MCSCASSMTKRCGCLMPSKVLSMVLLSMLTQRAAPGARKFLDHTEGRDGHGGGACPPLPPGPRHLRVDLFHLLDDPGTFSVPHVLTGLPETQVLRLERHKENKE